MPEIDETGNVDVLGNPEYLLDLRFSPCQGRSVNGQACSETYGMGRQHEVLDSRIDTRIPDLLTLANTVEINTTIDYDWHFLGVPKHLSSFIIHVSHPRRHSRATGEPCKPGPQHWFLETGLDPRVTNYNKFPWLGIASRGGLRCRIKNDPNLILRDRVRLEFPDRSEERRVGKECISWVTGGVSEE